MASHFRTGRRRAGRSGWLLLTLLVWVLAMPPTVSGRTLNYPGAGFSITPPEGWAEMPPAVTESMMGGFGAVTAGRGGPRRRIGFQSSPGRGWMRPPYLLVTVHPSGRIKESELSRMEPLDLALTRKIDPAAGSGPVEKAMTGPGHYDSRRHILWHRITLPRENGGEKILSATLLTRNGRIQVLGYAPAMEFDHYEPVFRRAAESVVLEKALRYRPGERRPFWRRIPPGVWITLLAFGVAFGLTRWLGPGRGGPPPV